VHLAQINVARLLRPLDHPGTADFVAALAPVNAIADAAPGFVWRLQTEDGDATAIRVLDDDLVIVNLTVWESLEALRAFVFDGRHLEVLRRRRDWFERRPGPASVLWWIPPGTLPTPQEGLRRLALLAEHGATPEAFDFAHPFEPVAQIPVQ
jgi:hypothetical protein